MPKLKGLEKEKTDRPMLIRVTESDYQKIKQKADLYTNGKVSKWVRYASLQEPRKEDLIEKDSSS